MDADTRVVFVVGTRIREDLRDLFLALPLDVRRELAYSLANMVPKVVERHNRRRMGLETLREMGIRHRLSRAAREVVVEQDAG